MLKLREDVGEIFIVSCSRRLLFCVFVVKSFVMCGGILCYVRKGDFERRGQEMRIRKEGFLIN